jgi:hypothetical protein
MKRLAALTAAALAICAPGAAQAASAEAAPSYREIKEWILACDNTATCVAKFVHDDLGTAKTLPDDAVQGYLSIEREAGPDGELTVTAESMSDDSDAAFDPSKMSLDGKPLTAVWGKDKDDNAVLEGDAARQLIRVIGDGGVLTFTNDGKPQLVSLSGLKAVLLAMDEAQGRLGNETALARAGSAPASAVPPAPPLPVVWMAAMKGDLPDAAGFAAKVRRAQAATLKAHACDAELAGEDNAYPLNDREALVVLGCSMAAYQGSMLVYRAPRAAPAKAQLLVLPRAPTLKANEAEPKGEYTEGEWEADTATFTESAKGRGLADCGVSTSWTFDGEAFHLSGFLRQERCGGPAGDWPTLYRSEVKPRPRE